MINLLTLVFQEEQQEQKQQYHELSKEEIQKLVNGGDASSILKFKQNLEQDEEQQEIKQQYKGVQFFGSSYAHFISKPQENENKTSNSNIDFFFDGPARNAAETFAKISDKPSNDSLGQVLKQNLQQIGVDCFNLDIDGKIKTSSILELQLDQKELMNITNDNEISNKSFQTVQYNFDSLYKLAYKFLYPKFMYLYQSDYVYADMLVNPNAIKALINNFANKLILHIHGSDNVNHFQKIIQDINTDFVNSQKGKKNKQQIQDFLPSKQIDTLVMNMEEFVLLLTTSRNNIGRQNYYADIIDQLNKINATQILLENYSQQKQKKVTYVEYLKTQNETVQQIFQLVTKLFNCKKLIIFINPVQTLFIDNTGLVAFTEHSCTQSCIKSNYGYEEAFVAGYLAGLYESENKNYEEILEKAGYSEISSLKVQSAVNNNLGNKLLEGYKQRYYVSYKEICNNQIENSPEQKEEL